MTKTLAFTFVCELTWKPLHFLDNFRYLHFDQRPRRVIIIALSFLLFSYISVKNLGHFGLHLQELPSRRSTFITDFLS
jgi:hypothetical protein